METERKRIEDLTLAFYNPRVDLLSGDQDYEKVKQSILKFGHIQPVVWNKETNNVVGGHQSLRVLKDLGYTEVDCVVVSLDYKEEKALNIALNKISGRWDIDKLSELMEELVNDGLEFFTGYSENEIAHLTSHIEQTMNEAKELNLDDFKEEVFQNKCPRCGFLF